MKQACTLESLCISDTISLRHGTATFSGCGAELTQFRSEVGQCIEGSYCYFSQWLHGKVPGTNTAPFLPPERKWPREHLQPVLVSMGAGESDCY